MRFIDFLLNHYEVIRKSEIKALSSICTHSNKVKNSSLFIALQGQKSDGHDYLKQAVSKGASVLLVEKTDNIPSEFKGTVLKYKGKFKNLSKILNEFYNFPSEKLFTVGVTGTNGKTSFCYLMEHLFKSCGWPTALIGTVDQHFDKHKWPASLTTPSPAETFERLNDFITLGAKSAVMEVSSIALDQNRIEGINFKALVFTNLSQDHLDYHGNMENYFQAKKKFFTQTENTQNKNFFCLVNQDDEYGKKLKRFIHSPCYTYGQDPSSDFCFKIKKLSKLNSVFELKSPSGIYEFFLPLAGEYNIYNAVAALACALLTGFKAEDCSKALKTFKAIPGRLQKVTDNKPPFEILIDYAHTPSALASVLKTLKTYAKKIIIVFGCGGDRDKDKRPQMIKVALQFADQIFFTTDNPRFEDPEQIVQDSLKSLSIKEKEKIIVDLDRKEAIKKAIQSAKQGDYVLIAGKGHENFQIVKDKKFPFSDNTTVQECLKELNLL